MRSVALFFLCVLLYYSVSAQQNTHWLRYSNLSPDGKTIAFSYRGDIYRVSSQGGEAIPLTISDDYEFMPVWSHDGKQLAYASNRFGNFDIYIVAIEGGSSQRLTWHSADEYPYDFDNDKVLFGGVRLDDPSNRQFPSDAFQELYSVPAKGGRVIQVLTTSAEDAKISSDGNTIIYHDRKGRENPWRKHQSSSVTRDIWLYDKRKHTHSKITGSIYEDRTPVFASANEIYYLSEADKNFNIYSRSLTDTSNTKQLTFFKQHPVRFLSASADGTLCFGYDGDIYIKRKNHEPVKINITISAGKKQGDEKTIDIKEADEMAVSPNGKEVAFISRGEVFVASTEGSNIKRITHTAGRERGISFSADGKRLLYASDRDNSWKIIQASSLFDNELYFFTASAIKETVLIANENENYQPAFSYDGKEIAYVENRNSIRIFNIKSNKSRLIIGPDNLYSRKDDDQYFSWSADGKWLLVKYSEQGSGNDEIGIIGTSGKDKLINLTKSGYTDDQPKWMMKGRIMIWNSDRQGLHSYANSSTRQSDIYAMFFDRELWENFKLNKQEAMLNNEKDTTSVFKINNTYPPVNWDGSTSRKEKLTIHPSLLGDALVSDNGEKLYYLSKFEKGYDLWETNLRTRETKMLIPLDADEASMQWDNKKENIYLLSEGRISKINVNNARCEYISIGTKIIINTYDERKNMFDYIWRRTKQTFYTAGLHGTKWDQYKTDYEKYLPAIDNNYDFAEMLNELLGELNVSHTGANYSPGKKDGDKTASLGIFYDQSYAGAGIKILEAMEDGPLGNPAYSVTKGSIIESINGEKITADRDFAAWLNNKEGKPLLLSIRTGNTIRDITIKPIDLNAEWDLIYARWVRRNEKETEKLSNGNLGYVHLYRMNDGAYRDTYDKVLGKYADKDGIVVDTRYNRGGDLASELVMFLNGTATRKNTSDDFLVSIEPLFRWTKPSILMACEANYSDGACFAYDYRMLKMGKLIGMPIPGSCTWQTGQGLHDETMQYLVPSLGVKTFDGRYMENIQLYPDIEVMNTFETLTNNQDLQLERAIKELSAETNKRK